MQPAELPSPTYWAMLYPSELRCTFWAMLHLIELRSTLLSYNSTEPQCTLLSYAEPYWATLSLTELSWILLSYAVPYWASQLYENYSILQPNWATFSTRTFFVKCRTVRYRNKGTPVRYRNATVPDWDAGCRRHRPRCRCRCPAMLVHSWCFFLFSSLFSFFVLSTGSCWSCLKSKICCCPCAKHPNVADYFT